MPSHDGRPKKYNNTNNNNFSLERGMRSSTYFSNFPIFLDIPALFVDLIPGSGSLNLSRRFPLTLGSLVPMGSFSVIFELNSAELKNHICTENIATEAMRLYYIHKVLQILSACSVLYFIFSPSQLCGLPINQKDLMDSCKDTVLSAFFVQKSISPSEENENNGTTVMQEIVINETYKEPETRRAKRSAVKILPTDEEQLGINNHSGTQKVRKSIENEKKNVEKTTTTTEKSTSIPVKKLETTTKANKEKVIQDEKTSTGTTTSTEAITKKDENTTKQKELGKEIIIPSENKNTTEEHEDAGELYEYTYEESNDNSTGPISDKHDWNTIAHDLVKSRLISVRHDACLKITSRDMIGLGHEFTSHQLRELRTPIIFVYSSIILCLLSIIYVFTKYTAPGHFSTLMMNLLHILLWAVVCVVLFQLRINWPSHWINSSNFQPEYPTYWIAAEVLCFLVLFGCLLEAYFADLLHYNLYLEQSAGVYEIIEPPRQYRCGAYEGSFSVDFVEAETQEVKTMTL